MIDASKTRKRQLAFELQSSRVFEKRSKAAADQGIGIFVRTSLLFAARFTLR